MTLDERYDKALAIFATENAEAVTRHLAINATKGAADALKISYAELITHEKGRLFAKHAASLGYSMPYQYAWHLVARDEEELRDWQMTALTIRGKSPGFDFVADNNIKRDQLGYTYRGD